MQVSRVGEVRCQMGEGPVWDTQEQALYFVDVFGKRLYRIDEQSNALRYWDFDFRVSSVALDNKDGAILTAENGLHHLDLTSGRTRLIVDPTEGSETIFLNDGKCDAQGRFLFGSVEASGVLDVAALFRLEADGTVTRLDDGFRITNGPCWSPDGCTFYFADTAHNVIYAYDYDPTSGQVGERRLFADVSSLGGMPDGATVDEEGHLWTAMLGSGKIRRIAPNGLISLTVDLPTCFVSSVMFGGPKLDRLYVTTIDGACLSQVAAAGGQSLGELSGPEGGAVFVVDGLNIRGLPEHRYAGTLRT